LPGLQLALSLGEHPDETPAGQLGVRTHSALAMLLGTAAYDGTRRAVLSDALGLLRNQIPSNDSREVLTLVWKDPQSAIILLAVFGRILLSPKSVEVLSAATIKAYSVPLEAIQRLTAESILP
jgi:hypothetical protein